MPITTQWVNTDKTIISLVYEKPWNWSDFQLGIVQSNALIDTVQHPVDMIIHMHDGLPRDVSPLRFRAIIRDFHPNIRSTALVGANDLIRRTITAFMRVMGQEHRSFFFAATMEEAYTKFAAREVSYPKAVSATSEEQKGTQAERQ